LTFSELEERARGRDRARRTAAEYAWPNDGRSLKAGHPLILEKSAVGALLAVAGVWDYVLNLFPGSCSAARCSTCGAHVILNPDREAVAAARDFEALHSVEIQWASYAQRVQGIRKVGG
jgi:hypothetical protein